MKKLAALAAITVFLSVDLIGCATASDVDDGITPGKRDGGISGDDADEDDAGDDGASDTGAKDSSTGTDAKVDAKSDAPSTDAKVDAKIDGGADAKTDGGGTACTVLGPSECMAAENLGGVSGDSNADVLTKSGTGNAFVLVEVSEDDSGFLNPKPLKATISLKSTAGANYDIYVYGGAKKGDVVTWPAEGIDCSTQEGSGTTSGDEAVNATWSDEQGIAGHSDNRILAIEIRSATATCSGGWDLTVEGNK